MAVQSSGGYPNLGKTKRRRKKKKKKDKKDRAKPGPKPRRKNKKKTGGKVMRDARGHRVERRGGAGRGQGRPPKVPGRTWQDKRRRGKELLADCRRECRREHAPGSVTGAGAAAHKYFVVWDGPKRTPKQGHIGPQPGMGDRQVCIADISSYVDYDASL